VQGNSFRHGFYDDKADQSFDYMIFIISEIIYLL